MCAKNILDEFIELLKQHYPKKPIVFVGSAGSGKSTVGRRFANKIQWQFHDSDRMVEHDEGMSVVEIYAKHGEKYFREKEYNTVKNVLDNYGNVVLSTGNNVFVNDRLRDLIKENAFTIWLYADMEVLYERIARRNSRPEFHGVDIAETLHHITLNHYPLYQQANVSVKSHDHDIGKVVESVFENIKKHLKNCKI